MARRADEEKASASRVGLTRLGAKRRLKKTARKTRGINHNNEYGVKNARADNSTGKSRATGELHRSAAKRTNGEKHKAENDIVNRQLFGRGGAFLSADHNEQKTTGLGGHDGQRSQAR